MARRRQKKRTHTLGSLKNPLTGVQPAHASASRIPRTMVIRMDSQDIGSSVSRLVQDVRSMMEPHTALRLRERRCNRLRDYVTMCGPLGVTSLLLFSRTEAGNVNLRIASHPRGPTVHFRVLEYSLCNDIRRALKNPKSPRDEFKNPPLLVMNNLMSNVPKNPDGTPGRVPSHELLLTTVWQNLFPGVSAQNSQPSCIKRVILLSRRIAGQGENGAFSEDGRDYVIDVRHYAISTKAVGVSRAIRRLNASEKGLKRISTSSEGKGCRGVLPNLGHLEDISEIFSNASAAGGGYTSESEVEEDAQVEVLPSSSKKPGMRKRKRSTRREPEKMKIILDELGPRMTLKMVKIEEGLAEGKVLWHAWEKKSAQEIKELDKRHEETKKRKEERKRVQAENVRMKTSATENKKRRKAQREAGDMAGSESEDGSDKEMADVEDIVSSDYEDEDQGD